MNLSRMKNKLKILMASAEIAPFAKVGGLADVVGSLPSALKKAKCDVRVIMPLYGVIDRKKFGLKKIVSNLEIFSGNKIEKINIWESRFPGTSIIIYFIDHKKYFGKNKVYFGNNSERFLFFSLAVVHSISSIKFKPNVIHCHDFHTALITNIIKVSQKYNGYMKDIKTVYTIHNLNYQGKSETELLTTGNLTKNSLKSLTRDAQNGDINFMVQGIINADAVNTVSETYSKEIATESYGAGLENIIKLNKNKIVGILNGIDVDFFNPKTDKFIKKKYSVSSINDKLENKLYLQKMLGLPQDKNILLVGFVSRLAWQKGIELINKNLIANSNCQFVFLGTGQKEYEKYFKKLEKEYPNKVSANIMFDIKIAQQIYAASDVFLMPSRFEPCGLGQMIAMRYGTVTIARSTGGLNDTIDNKVGFKFKKFNAIEFENVFNKALDLYYNKPKDWNKLVSNCMKKDFSWNKSGKKYLKLYNSLF